MRISRPLLLLLILVGTGLFMMAIGPQTSLDAQIYYSGEQARALLADQSPTEAQAYINNEILDFLFLITYTALFVLWSKHLRPQSQALFALACLPGLFDLIETTAVFATLTRGEPFFILNILGVVTFLKWSMGALFFMVALIFSWQSSPRAG